MLLPQACHSGRIVKDMLPKCYAAPVWRAAVLLNCNVAVGKQWLQVLMDNKLILKGVSRTGRCPDSSPNLLLSSPLVTSSSKLPADMTWLLQKSVVWSRSSLEWWVVCHWESPCLLTTLWGIIGEKNRIWQQSSWPESNSLKIVRIGWRITVVPSACVKYVL